MKRIVDTIIAEEVAARDRLAKARVDAEDSMFRAQKEAQTIIEDAVRLAGQEAQALTKSMKDSALRQRDAQLSQEKDRVQALVKRARESVAHKGRHVCELLVSLRYTV